MSGCCGVWRFAAAGNLVAGGGSSSRTAADQPNSGAGGSPVFRTGGPRSNGVLS